MPLGVARAVVTRASAPSLYTANPVHFDGANAYLTRGGALTGLNDGLIILFSAWFRVTGTGTERRIFTIRSDTSTRLTFAARSTNQIYVFARNVAATTVLEADGPAITDTEWHHILISCNLANAAQRAFLIDGVTASPTWAPYTNSSIDLAPTTPVITIGAAAAAESLWNGDLADVYFTTPAAWWDPAAGGNLAKVISGGAPPTDFSATAVTGTAPIVFLGGPTVDWHTNDGTGGGFTENGALTNGTSPVELSEAPFIPADLPNIVHWWHAVDSPKIGSPGAISQMDDLVGSLDVVQATGGSQPTDNTRTINGKVALDFDGADDSLTAGAISVSANGTVYGFWIGKVDSLVNADFLIHTGGFSAGDDGFCLLLDANAGTTGRVELNWSNGTTLDTRYRPSTPVIGTSTPHLIEFWIIGTTGGVNIAIDGVTTSGFTNTVGFATPEVLSFMARSGTLNELDGAFCEVGICTALPDSGNRASLLAYAQSYWGTP